MEKLPDSIRHCRTTSSLWGLAAAVSIHFGASGALGQAQQGPLPFSYTNFANPPLSDADLYWSKFFYSEPEIANHGKAFAAHLSIARPDSRQEFGVYYSPRVCTDIASANGVTVSTCPARIMRFYPDNRLTEPTQTHDVCIVHRDAAPPIASDIGWNAAQATFRIINGRPNMITFAVLDGELLSQCSFTIPLEPQ